jgi:hypothetical protein
MYPRNPTEQPDRQTLLRRTEKIASHGRTTVYNFIAQNRHAYRATGYPLIGADVRTMLIDVAPRPGIIDAPNKGLEYYAAVKFCRAAGVLQGGKCPDLLILEAARNPTFAFEDFEATAYREHRNGM